MRQRCGCHCRLTEPTYFKLPSVWTNLSFNFMTEAYLEMSPFIFVNFHGHAVLETQNASFLQLSCIAGLW